MTVPRLVQIVLVATTIGALVGYAASLLGLASGVRTTVLVALCSVALSITRKRQSAVARST